MRDVKSILITGGTGSFGKAFVKHILENYPNVQRLVIYSRDELKQYEMSQIFPKEKYPVLRYFIGDVRDRERIIRACENIDVIIHAAALKQVPAAEYNPMECIKTNILGAENVIEAALFNNVKKVVALSTDKAAAPINLYGATKLCSDKLFVAANNIKGNREVKFNVVRYGNVMASRGSVIPLFKKQKETGVLTITDASMTRFTITLDDAVKFVINTSEKCKGGEIFVPKIPSYKITDVAKAIAPEAKLETIGIRPGEKLHEEMITETDCFNTIEFDDYFVITPTTKHWSEQEYAAEFGGKLVAQGFKYSSDNNNHFLSIEELKELIDTL